ncbi:FAD-dependent oxidoreductase [Nocardia beijingensis]|uniref:flavin monoamine oxidase family protein n=1 Tax=Nocardia TaxID=1817 RepID=UPI0013568586|nr:MULTISPECIES: NAD(P)/FAD-dependent oxidoreductase [Nocardia]MBF6464085.1 FAD-dependent oxidoreductase [Nocardia beijingensis]
MTSRTSDLLFDESFSFPGDLRRPGDAGPARVAVIGAGASGLAAAYELQRHGLDVTVYERTARPGGRVRTWRFWDGTHGELGAMRIPGNHHCTLHYVDEFGLATRTFVNANPDAYYLLRGRRVRRSRVEEALPAYQLHEAERTDPLLVLERLLRDAWHGLGAQRRKALLAGDVADPELDRLAATSLWQFTRQRLSPDAWDLIGHASGLLHYEHASLLEVLVDYFGLFNVDQLELVDGTDALIRGFTDALRPGSLRLASRITELRVTGDGVRLGGERHGAAFTDEADFVICAVPAPGLDQIDISPALPAPQRQAIRGISYASSTKTLVHVRDRHWEHVDGIFGGGSFTDLPIQQVWYPSDNARLAPGATRWTAADPERSHAPAVLTAAYLWENNARRFAALPENDRTRIVLASLEQLHPGLTAAVDDVVHWTWDEQVGIGGGAFAYLAPGQHARYLAEIGAPHPHPAPRVFFAGEHLSVAHAWIQGALQSALASVRHLLDQVSVPRAA